MFSSCNGCVALNSSFDFSSFIIDFIFVLIFFGLAFILFSDD